MIELLICDLDGTLVDSFSDIRAGIEQALAAIGAEPSEELMELVRLGVGLERFYDDATGTDHESPAESQRFRRFVDTYRDSYFHAAAKSRPFEGVTDTLAAIQRRHPRLILAVATTKRTDMARRVVEQCGLAAFFHVVRGSDGLPHKPDPALLHAVAKDAGRPIERAVMVGDTDRDVGAAQRAGACAVAVTYGGWRRHELETLDPDHLVDEFAHVADLLQR